MTPRNGNSFSNKDIAVGRHVFDADGNKIGTVLESDPTGSYFVVEKGWLFTKDVYIPRDAVQTVNNDGIQLRYSKQELESHDWSKPPTTTGGMAHAAKRNQTTAAQPGTVGTNAQDVRVPLREEQLLVDKRQQQAGQVHMHKDVVTEQQNVTVPVTHEEVYVERVAADPNAPVQDDAFTERNIDVPVMGEDVVTGKQTRTTEEVHLHKQPVTEQRQVSDTMRKERLHVDGDENVPLNAEGYDSTGSDTTTQP